MPKFILSEILFIATTTITAIEEGFATPTTIIGMLGVLVGAVTLLLGWVVKWLLQEMTEARKDAVNAWQNANQEIVAARKVADEDAARARADAVAAWTSANKEIVAARTAADVRGKQVEDSQRDVVNA